ncbi:unnamed protein product [Cercospora beticola]|nr:unnamed protein product [Cercospora beticola]
MHTEAQPAASIFDYARVLSEIRNTFGAIDLSRKCVGEPFTYVAEILLAQAMWRTVSLLLHVMLTWYRLRTINFTSDTDPRLTLAVDQKVAYLSCSSFRQ